MQKITFQEALQELLRQDPRYAPDAYIFLKEALDYTIKMLDKPSDGAGRHVSASELLEGIRAYTLETFGPMSVKVLHHWGIKCTEDFGNLVFNLVRQGILGKTDSDRIEDFAGGYDFFDVFSRPFLPAHPERKAHGPASSTATPESATPEHSKGEKS